ncbi:LppC family lipoprotein [Pseudoxanthomonas kalamensis DSM 18571]|nr:LppC family lipoprotein [Pseudoxanthomonas kalamensis DSM 18571]
MDMRLDKQMDRRTIRKGATALMVLLALLLAACTGSQNVRETPASAMHAVFVEAGALAGNHASLQGDARADNARQIYALLARMDDAALARNAAALPVGDPLYDFAGQALLRRGLPLPRPFDSAARWRFDLNGRPPADADGYRPPVKLAVLLPLSGQLAVAAAPVRDGLLAGYYGENRRRPQIDFYDTAGTATGTLAAYTQASADGADFVLGPLGRDEVSALFRQGDLAIPVLALNRGDVAPPAGNAGFSLAPEDDGVIAAEYLLARERGNVLIIAGNDDSGARAARSFRERFIERGGNVVATLNVGDPPGDLSASLAQASGADAVFLAVKGDIARALTPQLALAGLGGSSRVGTSQLLSGTGKPEVDSALDGIVFPTEAWTSRGSPGLPAASVAAITLPTARGPAARLLAFGYDAWKLTAYLEKLVTRGNAQLEGATGTLYLDGFGNVLRTPAWSTFRGGVATPIADGG